MKRLILPVWVMVEEAVAGVEVIVETVNVIEDEFSNRANLYVEKRSRGLPKSGLESKLKDFN